MNQNKNFDVLLFCALGFGVMGVVLFLMGFSFARSESRLSAVGTKTEGMIIANESGSSTSSDGSATSSIVRFATADGQTVEFSAGTQVNKVGTVVPVIYDPQNPEQARVDMWHRWVLPVAFIGFGVLCVVIGLFCGLLRIRFGPGVSEVSLAQLKNSTNQDMSR